MLFYLKISNYDSFNATYINIKLTPKQPIKPL